jgi:hypothetical protein
MIGIVIGTYSSIYVASPIVVIWKQWSTRSKLAAVPAARPAAPPKPASPSPAPSPQKNKSGRR